MSRRKWGAFDLEYELSEHRVGEREVYKAIQWIGIHVGVERMAIEGVYVAAGAEKEEWNEELYRTLEKDVNTLENGKLCWWGISMGM